MNTLTLTSGDWPMLRIRSASPQPYAGLAGTDESFETRYQQLATDLYWTLGIHLPQADFEFDPDLPPDRIDIHFDTTDRPTTSLTRLEAGGMAVEVKPDTAIDNLRGPTRAMVGPAGEDGWLWVRATRHNRDVCRAAGLHTLSPLEYFLRSLWTRLQGQAHRFLTPMLVRHMTSTLARFYPDLVAAALDACGFERITDVLQALLEEGLSVRDLRGILESLLAVEGLSPADEQRRIVFHADIPYLAPSRPGVDQSLGVEHYLSCVRMGMKHAISHHYSRGQAGLAVYLLDPAIEQRLAGAALTEEMATTEREAIIAAVRQVTAGTSKPVILTSAHVRRRLWALLHPELPGLSVLAYQELSYTLNIQPQGRIEAAFAGSR